jgi:hypothetical protein
VIWPNNGGIRNIAYELANLGQKNHTHKSANTKTRNPESSMKKTWKYDDKLKWHDNENTMTASTYHVIVFVSSHHPRIFVFSYYRFPVCPITKKEKKKMVTLWYTDASPSNYRFIKSKMNISSRKPIHIDYYRLAVKIPSQENILFLHFHCKQKGY